MLHLCLGQIGYSGALLGLGILGLRVSSTE
jgi:hypothetical protein